MRFQFFGLTPRTRVFCVGMVLFMGAIHSARADYAMYSKVVNLFAESDLIRAEHHHDWSTATQAKRWTMISTTKDPFSPYLNNYSYLRLLDKLTGAEIFRRPVPALSHIWISGDSKYIVGLSNIQLSNPYQLVVYSRFGERLFERDFTRVHQLGVSSSVTNWVFWYKEPAPKISITERGKLATLSIEDPLGISREFRFLVPDEHR